MSDTLAPNEEAELVERMARNKLTISELEAENALLAAYYKDKERFPAGTYREYDGRFYVKITSNSRVDDALAKTKLPANQYNRLTKKVIDGTVAKKVLDPTALASITKVYDNKVEVGLL